MGLKIVRNISGRYSLYGGGMISNEKPYALSKVSG